MNTNTVSTTNKPITYTNANQLTPDVSIAENALPDNNDVNGIICNIILSKQTKNKRHKKPSESNIDFNKCYTFAATCPFKECDEYNLTVFKSQQAYQKHHGLKRDTRDKFRNNLVWKCPQCLKQCSSFYNFSAHVSMHRDLCTPPWICTLKPCKHGKLYNDKTNINICGKRSSIKCNWLQSFE